jgi:putative inorganic carbon (hco3(-)) transporter
LDRFLRQGVKGLCFLGIALLGCALSVTLYQVWQLQPRFAFAVVLAIAAVSVSMYLVRIFSDFLLVVLLFSLPFADITIVYFFRKGLEWYIGYFSVSLIDFLLIGLYTTWFYWVFVRREQSLPSLDWLDFFILWYFVAHLVTAFGSEDPMFGYGATEHLIKYVLFYFYLSRHLDERHLPWLLGALAFAIVLEATLGAYQFTSGRLVGLAIDKGAGNAETLGRQFELPGTEGYTRATGTSYDSHTYGHLMALLLPFPVMLVFIPGLRRIVRFGCMVLCAFAFVGVLLSLSRSAWLAAAISLTIGIPLMIAFWRERHMVPALAGMVVVVALVTPFVASFIYQRFATSPLGTLWERWDLMRIGWYVYTLYPVFGVGPGNWPIAMLRYGFLWLPLNFLHNVFLWIAVELGIFGLIPYIGILVVASGRFFSLARRRRDIAGRLALASLIALMATVLNGLTEPGFREPNVYQMFWLLVSLSAVLPRLPTGGLAIMMTPPRRSPGLTPVPAMATSGAAVGGGK